MISTMAKPNSSMRYWVGSKVGAENCFEEIELAQDLGAADHDDGGDHDADLAAHAAEHDDGEDGRRFEEGEGFRRDEACARGEERAGEAGEHRAHGESGELGIGGVDAERAAGDLVLAQRLPGAADRQAAQPHSDEAGEQRQRQDHVIEKDDAVSGENCKPKRAAKPLSSALNGMPKKVGRGMPMMPA